MKDEELIEKCLAGVKKRRFKPDWKGFSSCIQCERDTVARAIPIIQQEVWTKYRSGYLTSLSIEVEKAVKTERERIEIKLKPLFGCIITSKDWQAIKGDEYGT